MRKRIQTIDEFINEQEINEGLSDDWNPEHDYGVFRIGGSIGEPKDGLIIRFGRDAGMLISTFDNDKDAKDFVKRRNAGLSPGEKKYYGIKYKYKKLTDKEKNEIATII